jgi:uncharacterized protein (DUF362 family)
MRETIEIDGVYVKRLYEGLFKADMIPQLYEKIYDFLGSDGVRKQIKTILESEEIWIKPNLGNARPPETGCISHPITVKALVDCLIDVFNFKKPIRICETITYHKGSGITEILAKLPPKERVEIENKLKSKDPSQDIHDFGFELLLELSGIQKLVKDCQNKGLDVDILNLSKEPVMTVEERKELIDKIEQLLGKELIPLENIRKKLRENIPRVLKEKKIGLISLAVPKTHDDPGEYITAAMKNIALGMHPKYKAFMHKDIAKATVYHYLLWKKGCEDRVFGIVSGPYGMDGEGPIFGRAADFPYIIAGSDLLKVDCATAVLMFGKIDLINKLNLFKYAQNKVGQIPSVKELEKLVPYALTYQPYPYKR